MKKKIIPVISILILVLLAFTAFVFFNGDKSEDNKTSGSVESKLNDYFKTISSNKVFSGSVYVAKGEETLLEKGYGMANYELEVPNSSNTKFCLGSLSKQFTAVAMMTLEAEGKISVKDQVVKYIPELINAKGVTIEHLLTHTSGLPEYTGLKDAAVFDKLHAEPEMILDRIKNEKPEFQPGGMFRYMNTGYVLLGIIVSRVSGMEYEEFLKSKILLPLEMKETGLDDSKAILKNRASGYSGLVFKEGKFTRAEFEDMTNGFSAFGMYSTIEDMAKWDKYLSSIIKENRKPYVNIFKEVVKEDEGYYGYGFITKKFEIGNISKMVKFHLGGVSGFLTANILVPEDDIKIVVLTNNEKSDLIQIRSDVLAILYGENYKEPVSDEENKD